MPNSSNRAVTAPLAHEAKPDPALEVRHRAEEALHAGDWSGAMTLLREALDEHPDWGQGLAHLGLCMAHQGRLQEARGYLIQAARLLPDDIDVYYNLGAVYQQLGEHGNALSCYKEVVLACPEDHAVYTQMAESALRLGRVQDAAVLYTEAVRLSPDELGSAAALAQIHLQQGDLHHASEVLRGALTHHPDDTTLNLGMGLVLELQERYREALPYFRNVVLADDQHEEGYYRLGVCARASGLLQEAEAFLSQAVKLRPDYAEAWHELGELHHDRGDVELAIAMLEEALTQHLAIEERRKSWGESPDPGPKAQTLNALARCCQASGDAQRARDLWEESLAVVPDQPETTRALQAATPRYRRTSLTID